MSKQSGVTLIEFLVSSLLFLIVLAAVLTLIPFSAYATAHSRARVQADMVARSVVAEFKSRPFSSLAPASPSTLAPVVLERGRAFTPTVEIVSVAGYPPDRILELRVRVDWEGAKGKTYLQQATVLSAVESN